MNFANAIGIGVAGNFTGHLEQAGEAKDFLDVTAEENAPKGIFPFYVPANKSFLGIYPLSSSKIFMPKGSILQPEPEVALICNIYYQKDKVQNIQPISFAAYNDCSIRQDAPKISKKKNWGKNSKGISDMLISIDTFTPGGVMDKYNLVCFLRRDGKFFEYGENSEIKTYSYFYQKIIAWLIEKINLQKDFGPLESIHEYLLEAKFPDQAVISIGATRYTPFGEKTYLQKNDEVFVVVYDRTVYKSSYLTEMLDLKKEEMIENISILHQTVIEQ